MELITLIKYCLSALRAGERVEDRLCLFVCLCVKWLNLWLKMSSAVNIHG